MDTTNKEIQKVLAIFTFTEGKLSTFTKLLEDPVKGLNYTKQCDGFIDIECLIDQDSPNTLVLLQKWETKQNHLDYLQLRTEQGLFTQLETLLDKPPEIRYIKNMTD